MNLFLVTSPFQYICAVEAKTHYKTKNNILLLVNQPQEPGLSQQNKIVDESEWDHVIKIERSNRTINIPLAIKKIQRITQKKRLEHFFHAEYTAWRTKLILRNLDINKEVYFDDGTMTLVDYPKHVKTKAIFHRDRFFNDAIIRLLGCKPIGKLKQSAKLEVFTIFDLKDTTHNQIKNTFHALSKKYQFPKLYEPNAPLGFIGQGAIGDKYSKSIDTYESEILGFIEQTNKEVIYFPHRTEKEAVRKRIEKIKGVTYHQSELPLELELIDKGIKLSALAGIYSTVHFTTNLLFPEVDLYMIPNDEPSTSKERKADLEIIKQSLRDIGVKPFIYKK